VYEVYLYDYGWEKKPIKTCKTLKEAEMIVDSYKRKLGNPQYYSFYIDYIDRHGNKKIRIHVE